MANALNNDLSSDSTSISELDAMAEQQLTLKSLEDRIEQNKKLLRPVLNLSKSLDFGGEINNGEAIVESPAGIMQDLATMFGQRRIFFKKKAAFLLWRDYTRRKVFKRLKKDLIEKERRLLVSENKNKILQNSFSALGSMSAIAFFVIVAYYNYVMIHPYFYPIFLAILVAIPLSQVCDKLVQFIERFDTWYRSRSRARLASAIFYTSIALFILLSLTLGILYIPALGISVLLSASVLFFILAWKVRSQRKFIMSLYLVASFLFAVVFPSVFLVRNCVQESITLTAKINDYLQSNENLQKIMNEGVEQSAVYHKVVDYAATWGISRAELAPAALKARLTSGITILTNNVSVFFGTSYNVISNITNTLVSLLIFLSALFYIVSYKDVLAKEIVEVSPFTEKEQIKLGTSLKNSVSRIFICSLITGLIHFTATFTSFALLGLELKYIAAMISAFLAIIPVLSTWIIWVPVTLWLVLAGDYVRGTILASVHIFASYVLDPQVFAIIPGNPYYAGMSVFFGISAFGPIGALTGPLLAGILVTTMDIYKAFYASRATQKLDDNMKIRKANLQKVSTEVKRIQQIDEQLELAQ